MATFFEMMLETPINPVYAPDPWHVIDPDYLGTFTASYQTRIFTDNGFYHTFQGGSWADYFVGDGGADTMNGFGGDDTFYGMAGDDQLSGGADKDALFGGLDHDTLFGGSEDDMLFGGLGHDTLDGGEGDDAHYGGAGNDTIMGSEGADRIDGGAGRDTVDYSQSGGRIVLHLEDYNGTGFGVARGGAADGDTYALNTIERVIGSQYDDFMSAGSDSVEFLGLGGEDTLRGSGQDDILVGGTNGNGVYGFDKLAGRYGDDTFWFLAGDSGATTTIDQIDDFDFFGDDILAFDVNDASQAKWTAVRDTYHGLSGTMVEITDVDASGNSYVSHEVFLVHAWLSMLASDDFMFV
ncbi:MAG: calcium-binding protein [Pseudomonadota bacterium]